MIPSGVFEVKEVSLNTFLWALLAAQQLDV
jgi:hypothetical protein